MSCARRDRPQGAPPGDHRRGVRTDERTLRRLILQIDGLAQLVEDLRTVTLADSGHLDLRIAPVRLAREIAEIADLMAPDLHASGFDLTLELEDLVVEVDPTRVRQAIHALISNARRHAVRGTVTISLTAVEGAAVLAVSDQGPGIAPDVADRVFEPFVRGDPDRARKAAAMASASPSCERSWKHMAGACDTGPRREAAPGSRWCSACPATARHRLATRAVQTARCFCLFLWWPNERGGREHRALREVSSGSDRGARRDS